MTDNIIIVAASGNGISVGGKVNQADNARWIISENTVVNTAGLGITVNGG